MDYPENGARTVPSYVSRKIFCISMLLIIVGLSLALMYEYEMEMGENFSDDDDDDTDKKEDDNKNVKSANHIFKSHSNKDNWQGKNERLLTKYFSR
jgi:hypothetical protein